MKSLITLAALFISGPSFASTFPIAKDASVVKVEIETAYAHNCPGTLDLVVNAQGDNVYVIEQDRQTARRLKQIQSRVSDSCSNEISEVLTEDALGPVCLSFGHSQGAVFINVNQWSPVSEVSISVPAGLRIKSVTQLGQIAEQVLDCEDEPSINCCQAEIPSCISCRENARRMMRAWVDACTID